MAVKAHNIKVCVGLTNHTSRKKLRYQVQRNALTSSTTLSRFTERVAIGEWNSWEHQLSVPAYADTDLKSLANREGDRRLHITRRKSYHSIPTTSCRHIAASTCPRDSVTYPIPDLPPRPKKGGNVWAISASFCFDTCILLNAVIHCLHCCPHTGFIYNSYVRN